MKKNKIKVIFNGYTENNNIIKINHKRIEYRKVSTETERYIEGLAFPLYQVYFEKLTILCIIFSESNPPVILIEKPPIASEISALSVHCGDCRIRYIAHANPKSQAIIKWKITT